MRRVRTILARAIAVCALGALPSVAQQTLYPDTPPEVPRYGVDETLSPWACTLDALGQPGTQKCVFEWKGTPAADVDKQARDNVREASAVAPKLCAAAATRSSEAPDKAVIAACQRDFESAASTACSLEGKTPLHDGKGHLAETARDCFDELGRALSRTRSRVNGIDKLPSEPPARSPAYAPPAPTPRKSVKKDPALYPT